MKTQQTKTPQEGASRLRLFLDKAEVCTAVNLSSRTLERRVSEGLFPKPVRLSAGRVAWKVTDVLAWAESRISVTAEA